MGKKIRGHMTFLWGEDGPACNDTLREKSGGTEEQCQLTFRCIRACIWTPGKTGRLVAMSSESDWKVIGVQGRAKSERE
jgi:hypothetical protein